MAELMVRYDDLRRYCEKQHCESVPIEYIKQMHTIEAEPVRHGQLDEDKPLTNGDKIRAMTDEELAYFLTTTSCSICCDHPLNCGFDCASLYTIKAEKQNK